MRYFLIVVLRYFVPVQAALGIVPIIVRAGMGGHWHSWDFAFLVLVHMLWLVAAWAMVMMLIRTLENRDEITLGWLFVGMFAFEPYNRKYFWTFASVVAIGIAAAILANAFIPLPPTMPTGCIGCADLSPR